MSTGKQEEHHEPTGAAGARARRAVIMVAASVTAIYSWQHVGGSPDSGRGRDRASTAQGARSGDNQGFMDKMEERWRRRRDEGV